MQLLSRFSRYSSKKAIFITVSILFLLAVSTYALYLHQQSLNSVSVNDTSYRFVVNLPGYKVADGTVDVQVLANFYESFGQNSHLEEFRVPESVRTNKPDTVYFYYKDIKKLSQDDIKSLSFVTYSNSAPVLGYKLVARENDLIIEVYIDPDVAGENVDEIENSLALATYQILCFSTLKSRTQEDYVNFEKLLFETIYGLDHKLFHVVKRNSSLILININKLSLQYVKDVR